MRTNYGNPLKENILYEFPPI